MIWIGAGLLLTSAYLTLCGGAGSKWLPAMAIGGLVATISGCAHGSMT